MAREGSKKSEVIDLMRRSQGATLAEIEGRRSGWRAFSKVAGRRYFIFRYRITPDSFYGLTIDNGRTT